MAGKCDTCFYSIHNGLFCGAARHTCPENGATLYDSTFVTRGTSLCKYEPAEKHRLYYELMEGRQDGKYRNV